VIHRTLLRGARLPGHLLRRHRAKAAAARLASHRSPRARAVGAALRETLTRTLTAAERGQLSRIEERRAALLRSRHEIAVIDYGAGTPDSTRTAEEMEQGFPSSALVADVAKASKSPFWATLLFKLVRRLEPRSCVELGSCVGISAAYQAAALAMNGKGRLVSIEGSPEIARVASETLSLLQLRNASVVTGSFQTVLPEVLGSASPVDYFFNDGHHDHDAVLQYFHQALPSLAAEAVVVFDDISWSPGMRKAWTSIEEDERVEVAIDLRIMGVAVVSREPRFKETVRIPL
jgi:predicted O-methyltransferase YrrM